MAVQFTATKERSRRGLPECSARATSSLPVPLSPRTSAGALEAATRSTSSKSRAIGWLWPSMAPKPPPSSASLRRARFSSFSARSASAFSKKSRSSSKGKGLVR